MKRIKAKYFIDFNDNQFIKNVLLHTKQRLNIAANIKLRYNYERSDYNITMAVKIHGRWLNMIFDITKSDIKAEIDKGLKHLL